MHNKPGNSKEHLKTKRKNIKQKGLSRLTLYNGTPISKTKYQFPFLTNNTHEIIIYDHKLQNT